MTLSLTLLACTTSSTPSFPDGDEQTPPTSGDATAMQAWLDAGHYRDWQCEAAARAARGPSSHGENRVCSNDLASGFDDPGAERPAGTAAVKEFWQDGRVYGRAVYVKTDEASRDGDSWFWYVEIEGMGVLANGLGSEDPVARQVCVGCHRNAGSDAANTTSPHSGDFVFTQVDL